MNPTDVKGMGIPDFSIEFMTKIWGRVSARSLFWPKFPHFALESHPNIPSVPHRVTADDKLGSKVL